MLKLVTIFATIFIAELGDKTQLATLFFASGRDVKPLYVFAAAALALVASTAISVFLGSMAARPLAALPLRLIAGLGFLALGAWSIFEHFRVA